MSGGGAQKVKTSNSPQTATQLPWGHKDRRNALANLLRPWERNLEALGGPIPYFPGQTFAGPSEQTLQGIEGISGYLGGSDYLSPSSNQYLSQVLRGDFLNQENPALSSVTGALSRDIGAATRGQFAGSGRRMGGPSEVQSFQRTLADATAPYYYQDYARERGLQQDAAKLAPLIDSSVLSNLSSLINAGQLMESYTQRGINEQMERYDREKYGILDDVARYADAINRLGGGGGTTITTGGSSVQKTSTGGPDYLGAGVSGLQALLPLLFFFK